MKIKNNLSKIDYLNTNLLIVIIIFRMNIFVVYLARNKLVGDYGVSFHDCIEIRHVNKTLDGAKKWITDNITCDNQIKLYTRTLDDQCFNETPIYEVRYRLRYSDSVCFIIKKELC